MATTNKVQRAYAVLRKVTTGGQQLLTVRVTVDGKANLYTVTAEYDGMGLAVEWEHLTQGGRAYTLTLAHNGRAYGCNCPSRKKCKHLAVGEVLVKAGWLKIPG